MDKYIGFYIDRPIGNNIFSYEDRENKKIYVPKLIEGTLNDVLVGEEIVFNEIDEDIEIKAKGLKNMIIYKYQDKDVYIFDNHNHAFYFWIKSLKKGNFTKGCKLVHVDLDNIDDVFKYTNETLNVGSFIKPALKHDIFSEVIIIDSSYGFNLDIEGEYVLDIDLDIFSKDMDYIPYDLKVSKIKDLIKKSKVITIASSPFFIEQDYAIKVLKELFNYDII